MTPANLRTHWKLLSRSTNRILQGDLEDSTTYSLAHKLNIIASYFRRLGDLAESQKMYQASLSMRPDDEGTNNDYGALMLSQGELSKALEYFNISYSQDPIVPIVNKNIGMLMSRLGDIDQAAYFFKRAIDFGINEDDVYARLGEAYLKLGQLSPALHVLQTVMQHYQKRTAENVSDEQLAEKISKVQEWIASIEKQLQAGIQAR